MKKNSPKVVVLIVSWNSKKFIDKCITSVQASDYQTDIIVVDNNSADKSDVYIKNKYPFACVIQTGDNLGFTGGVNRGIKEANKKKPDYIFLLNPDAYIAPSCIRELVNEMERDTNIGMVCPKIYYANPSNKIWFAGSDIEWNKGLTPHKGENEIDKGQYDKICTIDRVCGCAVLINVKNLKTVGLFDNEYYLYFEEVDLSMRFLKNGFTIKYIPSAKCWHAVSSSSGGFFSPLYNYYMTRNNLLFMSKYGKQYFTFFTYHLFFRSFIAILRNIKKNPVTGIKVALSIIKGVRDYSSNRLGKQSYI
jgi:GT2 family glycosyltransferase